MNNKNQHASHVTDMNSLLLLLKFELGTQKLIVISFSVLSEHAGICQLLL